MTLGDFTVKKRKIGKGNLYLTENRLSWNEMCCDSDNHNYMCHTCANQLPPIFSTYFTKHVQTHNYPTRNAQDYSINKTKKMFSDCAIRNCGPTFWNSLDNTLKHCKTAKHFRNQLKSILLSEYNWLHFGACLVCFCVLCQFVKCIILQVCWNLC